MAGFWATRTVRFVPVFGESGALLEHKVFTLFYNLPLTIRRKLYRERAQIDLAADLAHAGAIVTLHE
jgi:hypothetical protein